MNHEDLKAAVENRKAVIITDTPGAKEAEREAIASDVERFLANGGQIQQVGQTPTHEPIATYSETRKRWTD
jgi:hypothetical protein